MDQTSHVGSATRSRVQQLPRVAADRYGNHVMQKLVESGAQVVDDCVTEHFERMSRWRVAVCCVSSKCVAWFNMVDEASESQLDPIG